MSTTMRMIWLVTLVFFVGGCSSYSVVYPSGVADDPAATVSLETTVKSGDKVRVTMKDDSKVKGKLTNVTADSLVVETGGPYNRERTVIWPEDVQIVELAVKSGGKTTLLVFGLFAGFIALIGISFAASGGLGSFGFESS